MMQTLDWWLFRVGGVVLAILIATAPIWLNH
jgi:hypothetical protein